MIRMYIFNFKKQTNKQTNKQKQEYKKAKETKEEMRLSPKNEEMDWKKNRGRPGEDFSRHSHFQK